MIRKSLLSHWFYVGLLLLMTGFQSVFGIYKHNFNNQNLAVPTSIDAHAKAVWSFPGNHFQYFRQAPEAPGLAVLGYNHTYVLTITLDEGYQANITRILLKRCSGDNASYQIRVNGENYGSSFTSAQYSTLSPITLTKAVSVRNTFTVTINVSNTTERNWNYTHIDDFEIAGAVVAYDPAENVEPDDNGIVYVNNSVGEPGTGASWQSPVRQVSYALRAAKLKSSITQIWVAAGTYQPDVEGESFALRNNLKVYGGFEGYESEASSRRPLTNVSILKGRGSTVIRNADLDETALLDGFTISDGSGIKDGITTRGAGMYNANSSPRIVSCIFLNNVTAQNASGRGGAVFNVESNPVFIQCIFARNRAVGSIQGMGGAVWNNNSSPAFLNCIFTQNESNGVNDGGNGSAIMNTNASSPSLRNTIIWNNTDTQSGASPISSFAPSTGTTTISYSVVQGGFAGGDHILDTDPKFNDPDNGDYRPQTGARTINAGDPATDLAQFPADETGQRVALNAIRRVANSAIDLGAFEISVQTNWKVNAASTVASPTGETWESAFPKLEQALAIALPDDEIWVAKGSYQPEELRSFSMIHGVKLYGAFAGTENSRDERPMPISRGEAAGASILRGNGSSVIVNIENGLDNSDILDGFTIKGGSGSLQSGGGMVNVYSSPTISNCTFEDNNSMNGGGGIFAESSGISVINTIFRNNTAMVGAGGAIRSQYGRVTLVNCEITNNSAPAGGAAVYGDNIDIWNCTISGNQSGSNFVVEGYSTIRNSIIYGNSSGVFSFDFFAGISGSIVQGRGESESNLSGSENPQFADAANGDFRLRSCSPAINRGADAYWFEVDATDVAGFARFSNDNIDMGAYEFQGTPMPVALPASGESLILPIYSGNTPFAEDCETIALIEPAGDNAVYGNVSARVFVDGGQVTTSGLKKFVRRHYELTPEYEGSANVTLFFTKAEFDDYNTNYGNDNDAQLPEKLKVIQYHGVSPNGRPDSYSGSMEIIEDVTVTLSEDGTYYAVSFQVDSFSGFFVSGQSQAALPVTLASFDAVRNENSVGLNWKTSEETNADQFDVQHSPDGKSWKSIGSVKTANADGGSYTFLHSAPVSGNNLYRLKMIDLDGTFAFSQIRKVAFSSAGMSVYPNPAIATNVVRIDGLNVTEVSQISILDANGKTMFVSKNPLKPEIDISALAAGHYVVVIVHKNGFIQNLKAAVSK